MIGTGSSFETEIQDASRAQCRAGASAEGIPAGDGRDPLPDAGPPEPAADLHLAALRPRTGVPGAAQVPRLLGGEHRRQAVQRPRGPHRPGDTEPLPARRGRVAAALVLQPRFMGACSTLPVAAAGALLVAAAPARP